ncbi:MAG: hypothetical protein KA216_11280, partial [Giesbergeria sp.]|nr:hypothetical protein [Giesbergeria sp.]
MTTGMFGQTTNCCAIGSLKSAACANVGKAASNSTASAEPNEREIHRGEYDIPATFSIFLNTWQTALLILPDGSPRQRP